jgi:hypothetical protein
MIAAGKPLRQKTWLKHKPTSLVAASDHITGCKKPKHIFPAGGGKNWASGIAIRGCP